MNSLSVPENEMNRYRITYILDGQLNSMLVWADSTANAQERFADFADCNALIRTIRLNPVRTAAEVSK